MLQGTSSWKRISDLNHGAIESDERPVLYIPYLSMHVRDKLQSAHVKVPFKRKFRLLNARNKVEATNIYDMPVLSYSFEIVNITKQEIQGIDWPTWRIMLDNRSYHPCASLNCLNTSINSGGQGVIDVVAVQQSFIVHFCTHLFV